MTRLDVLKQDLLKIAKENDNTYFVCMDAFYTLVLNILENEIPNNRIINMGISEQNAVSFASGLALSGKKVYLCIMSMYLGTKASEQLRLDLAYNKANVTLLGLKPGISENAKGGYSHWSVDDLGLIKNFPNMTIYSPGTIDELKYILDYSTKNDGPLYIRSNFSDYLNVENQDIKLGKMTQIQKGKTFAIIATGNWALGIALKISKAYGQVHAQPLVLSCPSIKPFDEKTVLDLVNKNIPIVTIEEHGFGGMSSIVAEIIAKSNKKCRFLPIYVDNLNFNIVGGHFHVLEKTMNLSYKIKELNKMLNKHSRKTIFNPFYSYYKLKYEFMGVTKYYKLLGIKLLKVNTNKHHIKYYLFGLVRILKIKKES